MTADTDGCRPPLDHSHSLNDKEYWWSRTPEERLRHAEYLRRLEYGDLCDQPMQKVFEVIYHDWPLTSGKTNEDGAVAPSST